jgi:hypothetical protein
MRSIAAKNKSELLEEIKQATLLEKRVKEDERLRAMEEMGDDSTKTIIMPKYRKD